MHSTHLEKLQETKFYGILDTGYVSTKDWISKFEALVDGGAPTIQVRAKKENANERKELLRLAHERNLSFDKAKRPLLIINDDIELCLEFPDVGLHIGQDDTPPTEARRQLGPDRIIGLSTHTTQQATDAMELPFGTIDYFAVGPIFATQTKPDYEPVGLELVKWVVSKKPALPFFCIGGINRTNAHEIARTGAARVVTVSDVLCDADTSKAVIETLRFF